MSRFWLLKYKALLWSILNLLLCWLLLQLYAQHRVQQLLTEMNEQYRQDAIAYGWPVLQLQAGDIRLLPWHDRLDVKRLELALPSGAVLLQLSELQLHGILTASVTATPAYQLSWQQLQPSAAVQALLQQPWQTLLQPWSGTLNWQAKNGFWHSRLQLKMADLLVLETSGLAAASGEPFSLSGLQIQHLQINLSKHLSAALWPWLQQQGLESEQTLQQFWHQQQQRCGLLPAELMTPLLALQQRRDISFRWQPKPPFPVQAFTLWWQCQLHIKPASHSSLFVDKNMIKAKAAF